MIKILHAVKGDPFKIVMGTVILVMIASLEGEGAVVFMIVCTALLQRTFPSFSVTYPKTYPQNLWTS